MAFSVGVLSLNLLTHQPINGDEGPPEEGGHPDDADDHDPVKDDSHVPGKEDCGAPDTQTNPNPEETHCSESLPTDMDKSISEVNCCGDLFESADFIFSWDSLSELEQLFQ
ncbi:hypothetical protein SAY87_015737 [Trapa incisa]|uniref:Uncharacterized protein n=1 Tax=Trapa incisa TaxID=236973 RepID=A0AAN7LFE0_9MYRT|nr:hypothetical protein SAY87_015737 [Trapa incisa]